MLEAKHAVRGGTLRSNFATSRATCLGAWSILRPQASHLSPADFWTVKAVLGSDIRRLRPWMATSGGLATFSIVVSGVADFGVALNTVTTRFILRYGINERHLFSTTASTFDDVLELFATSKMLCVNPSTACDSDFPLLHGCDESDRTPRKSTSATLTPHP